MALYHSRGRIASMSDVKSGVSESGYQWQNMELVLEIPGYQGTTTKQVFRVSGETVDDVLGFNVGSRVEVTWSMYAREWKDRMFNNVDLVKIVTLEGKPAPAPAPAAPAPKAARKAAAPQAVAQEDLDPENHSDDLPF